MSLEKVIRKVSQRDIDEDLTTKTESINIQTTKDLRVGSNTVNIKPSTFATTPQLLQQTKSTNQQSEKIVLNNKMIQDLLNESKKSNQANNLQQQNDTFQRYQQPLQQQRIIPGNGINKITLDGRDDAILGNKNEEQSRIQTQKDEKLSIQTSRKMTDSDQNYANFLSVNTQTNFSATASPVDQKRVLNKINLQSNSKRQSMLSSSSTKNVNPSPLSFKQISAKFKETDFKINPGNISTTHSALTQSTIVKTEDAYRIKPTQTANSNRRHNGSDITSIKSLRDIKSNDKPRPSFRIIEKANLTQRNMSINQSNTSAVSLKINSNQANLQMTPQQHLLSSQLPSPTNLFENISKITSTYYPSIATPLDSAQSLQRDKDSKIQFTLKLPNQNEYGTLFPSTQSIQGNNISLPPSQNSQRQQQQKTLNQIDLSSIGNGFGSQTDYQSTFRSIIQNQGGQNTTTSINLNGGLTSNKSKKFAQSFTQLTKIVNQTSPDKSPKDYTNFLLKGQQNNGDKLIRASIVMDSVKERDEPTLQVQYENSLKKEVPSALSDGPTTRQELLQMQKWFQNALNQISKINASKKVDHLSTVVELACQELLRQISVECSERGDLLQNVMRYQVLTLKEQIEQQKITFEKFKKQSKDEFFQSHKTYEGIFQSKDAEINKLRKELTELQQKLGQNISQMEQHLKNDKILREQLTRFKELATFMQQKQNESQVENYKLRNKIKKVSKIKQERKISIQDDKHFVLMNNQETKAINTNTDQPTNQSHNSSINSDLFKVDDNQQSERMINIGAGGVNESIDKLNYVRFTNPDDVKKFEVNQTQTGASLLIFNDMREAEVQTELQNLMDEDYDSILQDKLTFDQFVYKIENQEAQVEYLKQREINLIEQIESLKAEKNQIGDYGQHHSQSQFFQVTSPLTLNIGTPSRASGLDFDIPSLTSLTPHRKKKFDEVDTVLTEKYKNIMQKLNLDSRNVSESVSSESSEEEDDEDSPIPISKDEKAAKRAKRQNLIKAVQKKTNIRQLGEKINQVESLFNDIGRQIVEKVKKNKYHKFRNFMPLPTLLKQINLVYLERMRMINENPRIKEQECSNFTYFFLTKLYGFKKIVDQKFIIFMLSIKKYVNVLRVNLFARFIGLLENRTHNFSPDECNKYIEVLNYVLNISQVGQQPNPIENDVRYMVPFIRAMAFVGNFADSRMTFDEQNEFKKDIESLKENDSKGIHTAGLIDFDVFLNKMLAKYRQLVNRAKAYVINAFAASDLDGNGVCNLDEFLILNRHIEVDLYDEDVLTQIFQENTDRIIEGEHNLSFDKFAVVCVDYNLFTDEAQDKFLGIRHKREIDFKMQELQLEWVFRKRELKTIFEQLNLISPEQKNKWLQIIEVLNDKLQTVTQGEYKPMLIAYKILQNESKTLLQLEEECKRDEELLNQYQERALKDQKEQQNSFHMIDSTSRLSENGSPIRYKHKRSSGSQSGLTQMLSIPIGNSSIPLTGQKKMSQYANQGPSSSQNTPSSQTFSFNTPSLIAQQSNTSITITGAQGSSTSMEQNLRDANFIELMLQKLKNVQNKEKFLVNILLKNGVEEPTENDISQIQNIILSIDQNTGESLQNAKSLLFSFLMRQINQSKKTVTSQTLIS